MDEDTGIVNLVRQAGPMAAMTLMGETGTALLWLLARVGKSHGPASSFAFGATAMALCFLLIVSGIAGIILSTRNKLWATAIMIGLLLYGVLFGSIWLGFFSSGAVLLRMLAGVATGLCLVAILAQEGSFQALEKGFSWPKLWQPVKAAILAVAVAAPLLMLVSSVFGRWQIPMVLICAVSIVLSLLSSQIGAGRGTKLHRDIYLCLAGALAATVLTLAGGHFLQILFSLLAVMLSAAGVFFETFRMNLHRSATSTPSWLTQRALRPPRPTAHHSTPHS